LTSFDDFIESFCRLFYDVLRPIVIHNPHLETLTELSTILKVGSCMCIFTFIGSLILLSVLGFVRVMRELVLDIAERIFYRAVLYAESDVANYQPSPGDLAYPEKLVMMNNIAKQVMLVTEKSKKFVDVLRIRGNMDMYDRADAANVCYECCRASSPTWSHTFWVLIISWYEPSLLFRVASL
uniref:Conserved oligomeric Golgi complex subunit 3 n=1 Tax=Parascaris equorum TaxID=6256 RepID=A0A914R9Q5_PAREQ